MRTTILALALLLPALAAGSESWSPGCLLWLEDDFAQELHARDFRHVRIVDSVRDPETDEWVEVERASATASYRAWKFASGHLDLLGLAGFAPNGDIVIDRWELVGTGAQPEPETAHLPARLREVKKLVQTTLYRGPLGEGLYELGFDLRARYLLALVAREDGVTLYRFDNVAPSVPQIVLDSEELPELGRMRTLERLRHEKLGYVWRLQDDPFHYTTRILLVDGDDDGVFDGEPLVGDGAWFRARGLTNGDDWDSLTYFPRK